MIRYLRPVLLFLALLLLPSLTDAQVRVGVNDEIARKFKRFCEAVPREELFIHTDRDEFISGEALWLNAYLFDWLSGKPSGNSTIVYVELLNPGNRPVVQRRIKMDRGSGSGMLILPDTLSTGHYTLRGYTNQMKNFLPLNCFMKGINIFNAINGHQLKGNPGSGNFLTANPDNGDKQAVSVSGFAVKVNNLEPDTLEISVTADENFRAENGNLCYLFIQTHGAIDLNEAVRLYKGNTTIQVPKMLMTSGINHITLFSSSGEPLSERYIFTPFPGRRLINLSTPDKWKTRNKVSIVLEPGREDVILSEIQNLSISVAPVTGKHEVADIADYMVFGSEFGLLPDEIRNKNLSEISPEIIDEFLQKVKSNWIDWKMILSEKLPLLKYEAEKEDHLISGSLINSNLLNPDSSRYMFLSVPGKKAGFQYSKTGKDGSFTFNMPATNDVRDIIIQPDEPDKTSTIKIESSFSEKYLPAIVSPPASEEEYPPYISKWSVNHQVRKIYGSTSVGEEKAKIILQPEQNRFYGKPDIELIMGDYIKLPVMQEVFFELLPGVYMKSRKSEFEISIADPVDNKIYNKPPLLFIDGVVIKNPSVMANLDPELVEKIDVVKEKYLVGDYLLFGLVNVITRAGDFSNVSLPDYAVRIPYRAIDPDYSFVSPDYSSEAAMKSRVPDFRNTLYWNPSIKPDQDGKIRIEFWTSDYTADYEIDIQGLFQNGQTFSCRKTIKVE